MASSERAGLERCLFDFVATVAASAAYQGSKASIEGGKQLLLTYWYLLGKYTECGQLANASHTTASRRVT